MSKKNRNRKGKGGGGGNNSSGSGSSVTSSPGIGSKRPLSHGSPEAETKRQRDDSVSSMIADSVFEVTGIDSRDSNDRADNEQGTQVDKAKLTRELMEELEKFLQSDEIRVEGMGEDITGATVVLNTLLRRILPFFLTFTIDKVSELYRTKDTPVTNRVEQRTEGGCAGDLQSLCSRLKYENDRLEQYSRRESLRIFGLEEPSNGNEDAKALERKVLKVLNDTGAKVVANDISVMHRIGKKRSSQSSPGQNQGSDNVQEEGQDQGQGQGQKKDSRPVIVRFISRNKKMEIMSMKKKY